MKLKFDYKDGVLPRSVVSFYHSQNGITWSQIGSEHTMGQLLSLIENDSFFEVGGWGDGQSPGDSYLDGFIKQVNISFSTTDIVTNLLKKIEIKTILYTYLLLENFTTIEMTEN